MVTVLILGGAGIVVMAARSFRHAFLAFLLTVAVITGLSYYSAVNHDRVMAGLQFGYQAAKKALSKW